MSELKTPVLSQWIKLEMEIHRYHDINFKLMGPMGAPHRGQGRLMCIIGEHPNITQKQICQLCNMRQQSVSELLKKLEHNKYIVRSPSPSDKRISLFNLTEEGKKFASPPDEAIRSFNSFFSCLNEEEQKTMAEYLERIRCNIENMINNSKTQTCNNDN